MGVSLRWLLDFIVHLYDKLPDDLFFKVKAFAEELIIYTFESEIDEMLSFVGNRTNPLEAVSFYQRGDSNEKPV